MKRPLLATLICCAAGAAVADNTNVTMYGLIDMGYSWRGDNYNGALGSRSAFDSGEFSGTRLGFKGDESLGDGWKAVFTLEAGIAADTGGLNQGGLAWGRQSFAGLDKAGWGTATLGRQYTPVRNLYVAADPFALGSVGRLDNIITPVNPLNRADNALVLNTPYFGEVLAFEGMYSLNRTGAEATGNVGDTRFWNVVPHVKFFGDRLRLGASYSQWKVKNADHANDMWDVTAIGLVQQITLSAGYSRYSNGANDNGTVKLLNGETPKFDRWFLGAKYPVGNFTLMASYAYSKDKNDADLKAQQIAGGARYALSKRTSAYTVVSRILANNAAGAYGGYTVTDASTAGAGYRTGLNVGMIHQF
jgi:predicted porin